MKSIGCFNNHGPQLTIRSQALPSVKGNKPLIAGDYFKHRRSAIRKCALIAASHGYRAFGIRRQGLCATGPKAHLSYNAYGPSNLCRNGKGSLDGSANNGYIVSGKFLFIKFAPSNLISLALFYRGEQTN